MKIKVLRLRYIFIIILSWVAMTVVNADVVETSIDSLQIIVGEQTSMHVTANVKAGQKVQFQQYVPLQQITPGVEIVEAPKIDTVVAEDGYLKVTQHLLLTSWEDSLYYIPGQKVRIDGKVLQSKNLALKVITMDVDTLHPNQFYGQKDVQDNPFLWDEWSVVLWLSLGALILYVLCWLAYLRLKSNKPIQLKVRIVKKIPPHQRALTAIDKIKDSRMPDNPKLYYTQLTDTLRKYMEERFGFNAMEMTSAEIIEQLRKDNDQEKLQELTMLFETADLVKFAKYTVGISENDRNLVSAIDFINVTKQDNVPTEERIEPTVTEQQKQTIRMRLSLKWAIGILMTFATALFTWMCWLLWELCSN